MKIKSLLNSTRRGRHCFALLVLMAIIAPASVLGQETLTVHDGTTTNGYVPLYGYYADAYLKCEMVYPAAELAEMAGGDINSLKFYASQSSVSWGSASFRVFMTEVASTQINAYVGPGTVVYEGALSISNSMMVVNFAAPYTYSGGNLLIGVYSTNVGSWVSSSWYGETVSGASIQGYSYSLDDIGAGQQNFLPKTTFSYEFGNKPKNLAASNVTAHEATLSWTAPNEDVIGYQYQYMPAGGQWTSLVTTTDLSVNLSGLLSDTDYTIQVKALYPDNGESDFSSTTFHTEVSCPVPTNLQVASLQLGATTASLSWTENGSATNWVLQYGTTEDFSNATSVNVSGTASHTLTGLTLETKYYARVKADCGGGDQSQWSNTISFKPTNCNEVTIGTQSGSTYYYPVNNYYNYSLTQQIYTAAEIGTEGLIRSISFYYNYTEPFSLPEIKLFLKNVDRNSFSSTTDMEPLTTDDLVWTGTLSATEAGWVTIDLDPDHPFAYDGVSNLLVGVWDNTEGYLGSSYTFRYSTCSGYKCIYWYYSNNIIDPYNTNSSYTGYQDRVQYRNNIKIGIEPATCPRPVNLQATLTPGNGTVATLSWTENGSATNWVLQYGTDSGFATGTYTEKTTGFVANGSSITADLTGLTSETLYYARVKADCSSDDQSAWSKTVEFKPSIYTILTIGEGTNSTSISPVSMNYSYSYTQQIYTAEEIGTEGLINAISFYYNASSFPFTLPNLRLYMKNVTRSAFTSSTSYNMEPVTPSDVIWEGSLSATDVPGWVTIYLDTPFAYDGTNLLVGVLDLGSEKYTTSHVFRYTNCSNNMCAYRRDNSSAIDPYNNSNYYSASRTQARNNIQLRILPSSCPRPVNLQATLSPSDVTVASLSWTEKGSATSWVLQYSASSGFSNATSVTVSGTPSTDLSGLTPETRYYARVKADCGSGSESEWSKTVSFKPTYCNNVAIGTATNTLPYYPVNVNYNYSLSQQVYTAAEIGTEGLIHTISFYYDSPMPFSLPDIKLFLKNVSRNGFASNSDIETLNTADLVWTGTLSATQEGWVNIDLPTPFAYDGVSNLLVGVLDDTNGKLNSAYVFRYTSGTYYGCLFWYSDNDIPNPYNPNGTNFNKEYGTFRNNIQIGILPPSCAKPVNLQASLSASDATVATLTWTEGGSATNWVLEYGTTADFTGATSVNVSTTPSYDLTGLTPETRYYARVKANCGGGNESVWSKTVNFKPTNCIVVSNGTDTGSNTNYFPVYTYYNYSLTQQIYTAEEIGNEGLIYSISFYYNASYSFSLPDIKMYMKNVTRSAFASTTDMEPLTTDDLVWTGTLSANEAGWLTIDIDPPFEYDGVSNLLVSFWDDTNGKLGNSNYYFLRSSCSGNKSIMWYYDGYIPNPYNTTNGYSGYKDRPAHRNNIQLNILPSTTPRPTHLAASNIAARSVTLSWTAPAENLTYQYQYKAADDDDWTTLASTTNLSVEISGLTPETEYSFQVKALYPDNGESGFTSTTFTTIPSCLEVNTPTYSDLTAHSVTISWTLQDENQDKWDLYYTHNYEDHPDNQTTYGTLITDITTNPYVLGLIPEAPYYVYVRANCGDYDGYSAWSSRINIYAPTACFVPNAPTVSNVTTTSADIAWTRNSNGEETAWQVSYSTVSGYPEDGTIVDVTDTPSVTLHGLDENTTYYVYVRANCGDYDGVSNWDWTNVSFTTLQAPVTVDVTHPYSDGFENGNNWAFVNRSNAYYSIWMIGDATSNKGSKSMYIGYRNSNDQYFYSYYNYYTSYAYATKRFHLAPGTYEVSYDWRCRGELNNDYCRVALVPDDATFSASSTPSYNGTTFSYSTVPSGFIVLDNGSQLYSSSTNPSWTNQYNEITITEEADYKVLFYWKNSYSNVYTPPIAIDNFLINVKVGPAPSDLVVSDIQPRSAQLSWTENGTATSWQVKYTNSSSSDPYNDNVGTVLEATTTPSLTLTDLRPESFYCVYVRSCIEVDGVTYYTRWSPYQSFWTGVSCYPVTDLEVTSLTTTTATLAWDVDDDQPTENSPSSWLVEYAMAPRITYDFEANMPDYDDDYWAVGEETGNHYLYNLESSANLYFDVVGGGAVTIKAKNMGEYTGWIDVYYNNSSYSDTEYAVYSSSEYETYQLDLSDYSGMVELRLLIYNYIALDDITVNQYAPIITHPTFDFSQGTIYDYADADGWSLDGDEGYIVSEANYTNEWGGAWVDFPIQLGGQVSFRAKALEVTEAEQYTISIWDTNWDVVIAQKTISVTNAFDDYSWDLSDYSGYGYLEFIADNQPSLAIDNLTLDYFRTYMTQIVEDDPTIDITGLQPFAFYDVNVRALCGDDDVSQWQYTSFITPICDVEDQCAITYNLYSPYDGAWEDYSAYIKIVHHESGITAGYITMEGSGSETGSLNLCDGETYDLIINYYKPKSSNTIDFAFYAPDGYLIVDLAQYLNMEESTVRFTMDCNACHLPDDLSVTNLMTESALVTWQQGDAEEAYNVRYRKAGGGTLLINEGFESLQEGLPTNWLSAISTYVNDQQVFEIDDEVWDLVSIQGGAISGNNMLQANEDGLLLIPVQNAGWVSLKVSGDVGEIPFDKKDIYSSLAIGVFNGDINNPFELTQENIKLEVNPSGTQTCSVDLDGYTGYLVVYAMQGFCIDDVMVYAPVPWTTLNDYEETSLPMSNLEAGATYQVQVQSICDADDLSRWGSLEFTTPLCDPEYQCNIKYVLWDNCNDGWEDAYLSVVHHTSNHEIARLTISSGGELEGTLAVCEGEMYDFIYTPGYCCYGEHSFVIYNHLNEFLFGCETGDAPDTQTTMFTYEVNCSNCLAPADVDYEADVTEATIYWVPGDETQTAWEIQYSTDQTNWTTVAVTSEDPVENYMSYTIENLSASTYYYVRLRTNCGDDGYSMWTNIYFHTDCAEFYAVPYYEDFQAYNYPELPLCWDKINTATDDMNRNNPCVNNVNYNDGSMALKFSFNYSDARDETAILPRMESISGLKMSFDGMRREPLESYQGEMHPVVIGVYDDSDVFHTIASIDFSSTVFSHYSVTFEDYDGANDVGRIAIFVDSERYGWSQYWLWVDNISVEPLGAQFVTGWNWWAPTVETNVLELEDLDELESILSQDGTSLTGDINLVAGQMYKVLVSDTCTLSLDGEPFTTATVSIASGLNWFGFIGSETSVTNAFASFNPVAGDKVISQNEGFAIYDGEAWVGTLTTLVPGKGYVYVSQDTETKTLNLGGQ